MAKTIRGFIGFDHARPEISTHNIYTMIPYSLNTFIYEDNVTTYTTKIKLYHSLFTR